MTARRRTEALQDVPISITAVSGQALTRANITDVRQLQTITPSLGITTNNASRQSVSFEIRGQRTNEVELLTDPPVATYFAEVVQPRPFGFTGILYDISNVQVLKGVQGTLFGRNVTGGAVSVEPNHPTDTFSGELRGQYGNYNLRDAEGFVNLPLGDMFSLRVAGEGRSRDGYTTDAMTGRKYDDVNQASWRVSLLFKPTSQFQSLTIYDDIESTTHGSGAILTGLNLKGTVLSNYVTAAPFAGLFGLSLPNPATLLSQQQSYSDPARTTNTGIGKAAGPNSENAFGSLPFDKLRNWGVTNKTQYQVDGVTFKNILSFREIGYSRLEDLDGSTADFIDSLQYTYTKNYNEEFQVQGSALDKKLDYTVGAYFFLEQGEDGATESQFAGLQRLEGVALAGLPKTTPLSAFNVNAPGFGTARTYAFYAAANYALTSKLKLAGGIRYTNDFRDAKVSTTVPGLGECSLTGVGGAPLPLNACTLTNNHTWDQVTWDVTLQYEPTRDTNLYVSTRHGFRAGGFSLRAETEAQIQPFDPEYVQEYEIGAKRLWRMGDYQLTTNGAVFYQDYKDVQVQNPELVNGNVQTLIQNTASEKLFGGEFEANLHTRYGLDIGAFYSLVGISDVVGAPAGDFKLIAVPKDQAGVRASYAVPVDRSIGEVILSGDLSYRSFQHLDDKDASADQGGYSLANARLAWNDIHGSHVGLAFFVNNLLDKTYRVGVVSLEDTGDAGTQISLFGEPRTYGAEAKYSF